MPMMCTPVPGAPLHHLSAPRHSLLLAPRRGRWRASVSRAGRSPVPSAHAFCRLLGLVLLPPCSSTPSDGELSSFSVAPAMGSQMALAFSALLLRTMPLFVAGSCARRCARSSLFSCCPWLVFFTWGVVPASVHVWLIMLTAGYWMTILCCLRYAVSCPWRAGLFRRAVLVMFLMRSASSTQRLIERSSRKQIGGRGGRGEAGGGEGGGGGGGRRGEEGKG